MPQTDMSVDPYATRVWTAARHGSRHRGKDVSVCLEVGIVAYPTSYAAHAMRPIPTLLRAWHIWSGISLLNA
jgi:hypothetical protein